MRFTIVGFGEALYDIFPGRQVMGGAPLNATVHAHQLGLRAAGRGVLVTRVGQDALGGQLLEELKQRGLCTDYIQTDPDHATGRVYVSMGAGGEPSFDIVRQAAWDWINFDPDTGTLASQCDAVCFGTLVQREGQARNALYRFLGACPQAIRLLDVNLRQQYYDRRVLQRSLEAATIIKANQHELGVLADLLGLDGGAGFAAPSFGRAQALLKRFRQVQAVVVTRGRQGTAAVTGTGVVEAEPATYPPAEGADAVGAGDACAAAVLIGLVLRWPWEKTLNLANHAGAYVASQPGATPLLPEAILAMVA